MIILRRAQQRYDNRRGEQTAWLSFYAQAADDALAQGFGAVETLDEIRLPPDATFKVLGPALPETVTYVLSGALTYDDSLGRSGIVQAGEFRCVTAPPGVRSSGGNASRKDWTHLFQIGLRASGSHPPTEEQRRFSAADRRDRLCLVAAVVPSAGALHLHQNADVYSTLMHPGQHLVHDLRSERRAWLHVVSGEVVLDDLILTQGDGAGVSAERALSFTARADAEVLLIDVA
jgi:redox-sensitive bicupin YhaK (pirin superfamily)